MSEPTTAELVEKLRELPEWGEIHDDDPIVQILNRAECALLASMEWVEEFEDILEQHGIMLTAETPAERKARAALVALLED